MRKINGWGTIFWIAMLPISIFTGLINIVAYVSILSIYALITGHLSAWQAARVEVEQKRQEEESEIEEKVDKIHHEVVD